MDAFLCWPQLAHRSLGLQVYVLCLLSQILNGVGGSSEHAGTCLSRAYVTQVSNDDYAAGATVLGRSLSAVEARSESACPVPERIVLIADGSTEVGEISRTLMKLAGWHIMEVAPIKYPRSDKEWKTSATRDFSNSYLILRAFEFTQFDRLIYLDADGIALKPLDHFWDDRFFRGNITSRMEHRTLQNTMACALMIFRPNPDALGWLLQPELHNHEGWAIQGLINTFFKTEWLQKPEDERIRTDWHMGMVSCIWRSREESYRVVRSVTVLDYQGGFKPWLVADAHADRCPEMGIFIVLWWCIMLAPPSASPSVFASWIKSVIDNTPEAREIEHRAMELGLGAILKDKEVRHIYPYIIKRTGSLGLGLKESAKQFGVPLGKDSDNSANFEL